MVATMAEQPRRTRDDLVVVISAVPERVADLVSGLDEPRLTYRHAPAFPTLKELIGHLAEVGAAVDAALRQAYLDGQKEVRIKLAIDPTAEPDLTLPASDLLESYARVRRRTVDLLRGLSGADWKREVFDPAMGPITLNEICELIATHELGHLSQVRNLITLLPDA
jgi:DinB superfamily